MSKPKGIMLKVSERSKLGKVYKIYPNPQMLFVPFLFFSNSSNSCVSDFREFIGTYEKKNDENPYFFRYVRSPGAGGGSAVFLNAFPLYNSTLTRVEHKDSIIRINISANQWGGSGSFIHQKTPRIRIRK